jgi:hypothetical protein
LLLSATAYPGRAFSLQNGPVGRYAMRYIRFIAAAKDETSGVRGGLFSVAYDVARDPDTPAHITEAMWEQIRWFEVHLPQPERFTSTRSKGWYRREGRAISWFKPEAAEAISRARVLAGLLDSCGVFISVVTTIRPGVVTYEDALQIVAEPFSDTACG